VGTIKQYKKRKSGVPSGSFFEPVPIHEPAEMRIRTSAIASHTKNHIALVLI
jgi:hypothetical protein